MEKFWHREGSGALHTLGTPAYLSTKNMEAYYLHAKYMNHIIITEFPELYNKVIKIISDHVQDKIVFDYQISLPGFHIYEFLQDGNFGGGGWHYDLPFKHLNWDAAAGISPNESLSFTLPILMPSGGGGIDFDGNSLDYDNNKISHSAHNIYSLKYNEGEMIVFSGMLRHKIAETKQVKSGEFRVTLQGHCVKLFNRWVAYW
ncbi:hypothetical protein IHN63_04375 [Deinococcus sp. 6YEL10]|uniref:hypothetical protein n=1 Tax=Deinococcus sp. 6YEL10 TaxID=2745870 RepID=UPI001E650C56|nr:hypothetical protein [Deinococcus sp. 6YEL10]MCD0160538.1 hypothetical protein [Deinococcus sp. 6YEL10]